MSKTLLNVSWYKHTLFWTLTWSTLFLNQNSLLKEVTLVIDQKIKWVLSYMLENIHSSHDSEWPHWHLVYKDSGGGSSFILQESNIHNMLMPDIPRLTLLKQKINDILMTKFWRGIKVLLDINCLVHSVIVQTVPNVCGFSDLVNSQLFYCIYFKLYDFKFEILS